MADARVPFGAALRAAHFSFAPDYLPVSHGAFGAIPRAVRDAQSALRAEADATPDPFVVFRTPALLAESRARAAQLVNAAGADELVLLPNVTTGIDTVLRNIAWRPGDVVVCYDVVYSGVAQALAWLTETSGVRVEVVPLRWPLGDAELVQRYVDAVRRINNGDSDSGNDDRRKEGGKAEGQTQRVRLALCDTVISMPGVRLPFEKLVPALQAEGAMVLLDAAHGIGHVALDVQALQPDFMLTSLHKWLFVPRGCAALYVPRRNQHLIRTSVPTSLGFVPKPGTEVGVENPLPRGGGQSGFVGLFDYVGTVDNTNFLCVPAALDFRDKFCGGEQAIMTYNASIARTAGDAIANFFGTEVLDHPNSCIRDCAFANIRIPLSVGTGPGEIVPDKIPTVQSWLRTKSALEMGMYVQTIFYEGCWWWRICGIVYMELEDYMEGARRVKVLCNRIKNGELGQ